MPSEPRLSGDGRGRERGSSLIGTAAGLAVFVVFLLFAVQVLVGLYARTMVRASADAAARRVAGGRVDHTDPVAVADAEAAATATLRASLGPAGQRASVDWSGSDNDQVVVRVRTAGPRLLGGRLAVPLTTDTIDATVRVRVETPR